MAREVPLDRGLLTRPTLTNGTGVSVKTWSQVCSRRSRSHPLAVEWCVQRPHSRGVYAQAGRLQPDRDRRREDDGLP